MIRHKDVITSLQPYNLTGKVKMMDIKTTRHKDVITTLQIQKE